MTPKDCGYIAAGVFIGVGALFYKIDTPRSEACQTYKVATKSVVSYALKAPTAPSPDPIIIKEKCPAPDNQKLSDEKTETIEQAEDKPRRRHRHMRRHRRW